MAAITKDEGFTRLVERLDPHSSLLCVWPLTGGVSAQVTAFQFTRPNNQPQTLLVRRHGERDRQRNPQIATDEFKLLQILQAAGIAAPAPYYLDQAGEFFAIPCLVMEYVEGVTDFAPADLAAYLHQAATHLAAIHRVAGAQQKLAFLPRQTKGFGERPAMPDDSLHEEELRNTLEALWPISQVNPSALLHGDFWPGNLLWQDGRLAAVIDWGGRCRGRSPC
ncbi:MAG: phosphotransferase [Caldilineaceae bacterium]